MRASALILLILAFFAEDVCGQIRLQEWVATNVDGLLDEDGDSPDWMEIVNLNPSWQNLEGYGLSDKPGDPFRWVFPSVPLGPGRRVLVFASGKDRDFFINEKRTVIDAGALWRHWSGLQSPPLDWRQPNFDDQSWPEAPSGFGYGDGDDATVIQAPTVCLRHRFYLSAAELQEIRSAYFHADFDDGYAAWLNGVEIARVNLGAIGSLPDYDQLADREHEAELYRGAGPLNVWSIQDFTSVLQVGWNVLAAEVHNVAYLDDDLSFTPYLSFGLAVENPAPPHPDLFFPDRNLHANFGLDATGEDLLLTDPNGQPVDRVFVGPLPTGFSQGRKPVLSDELFFFEEPSPGLPNLHPGLPDFAPPVLASPPGGWVSSSVTVSLSTPSTQATIHYSLDGSEPTLQHPQYSGPILLSEEVSILRARAFENGLWPGSITTHTYLRNRQRSLPVWSLVTDPEHLWDWETGIYVLGPGASIFPPNFGANFWKDWERPMHVEFFETDGSLVLRQDTGVKIHGGWSRSNPQKSLRLMGRDGYGKEDIEYPFFGEEKVASFRRLLLRNSGNDWCQSHLRDGLMHELTQEVDLDVMAFRPSVVLLNGEYWGIHNIRERMDRFYVASHHNVDPDQIDLLEMDRGVVEGDTQHYDWMLNFIETHDMRLESNMDVVASMMEIDQFTTYNIFQIFFGNTDWPQNNIKYWRPRTAEGRWRWLMYDTDFGLGLEGRPENNDLHRAFAPPGGLFNPAWAFFLMRSLIVNDGFRIDFINRYSDYLNTWFKPEYTLPIAKFHMAAIGDEIKTHQRRWNFSIHKWTAEEEIILDFLKRRPAFAAQHLAQEFGLRDSLQLDLAIQPAGTGSIRLTGIEVDRPYQGQYFQNVPIRLTAVAMEGFAFDGWSDPTVPQEEEIQILPQGNYQITAKFRPVGSVLIHEINYNSEASADAGDWVELFNFSNQAQDLSGWELRDDLDSHRFVLPLGTVLRAGGYLVLCEDQALFQSQFPGVPVLGDWGFGLSGNGEQVRLFDDAGNLRDLVHYDDESPWPPEADGQGPTLELYQPWLNNDLGENWRASLAAHGTPGAKNSVTP
ncbi:MAG: hypothetical protein DWQ01_12535 [Planctomycetota bacterium]|nr:MAG: hypothetical protein DWQ01_12535 [Planctomycetota bacterium]